MDTVRFRSRRLSTAARFCFCFCFFFFLVTSSAVALPRKLRGTNNNLDLGVELRTNQHGRHRQVVLDNGVSQVTLSIPDGQVTGIKYKGIENLLETRNEEDNRGYWDVVWYKPGTRNNIDRMETTNFRVITQDSNQVEVSFTKKWDLSNSSLPLNMDKRYILRRGEPGIYMYTILERLEGWPDVDMDQLRVVFKLQQNKFQYMALSDSRQRTMPLPQDRESGQPLEYPEAVLLTRPRNPDLRGEVDDKYQYSCEYEDNYVHGWISEDPAMGFWMITPSNEFRTGGPKKQELTSHVGPTVLNMFTSTHYAGKNLDTTYRNGEPWKKVLGPVFVYLNSVEPSDDRLQLWQDAKEQASVEIRKWPYNFVQSGDFPTADQRGTVVGQLLVSDRYVNESLMYARNAYVGLAAPGDVGSWQRDSKGYQFWTRANRFGHFTIPNVRPGNYSLYGWVPGFIGDYKYEVDVTVEPGSNITLGVIKFYPPRNGPTLWEIGIPDRSAGEFYIPDANPTLMNKLYTDHPTDKFRQYGLWERYTDLYPYDDLVYNVGVSNYERDWFFAHVTRHLGNKTYQATTWRIVFDLQSVNPSATGSYTLQMALASASYASLQVRVNFPNARRPLFATGLVGRDNAIARHGIHGLYWLYSIDVPSYLLREGSNTIYITQSKDDGPFNGFMYDYIRLEGPTQRT